MEVFEVRTKYLSAKDKSMNFNTSEELIDDIRCGKMIILVDDEDRIVHDHSRENDKAKNT